MKRPYLDSQMDAHHLELKLYRCWLAHASDGSVRALRAVLQTLGDALGGQRAYLLLLESQPTGLPRIVEWFMPSTTTQSDAPRRDEREGAVDEQAARQAIDAVTSPMLFDLRAISALDATSSTDRPATAPMGLRAISRPGMQAILAAPVIQNGERVGIIAVEAEGAAWSRDQVAAIEAAGAFASHMLEQLQAIAGAERDRRLLRTLIDALPDLVYFKDLDHRFILVNAAAARVLADTTPDELIGKTDADCFPADIAEMFRQSELKTLRQGQSLIQYEGEVTFRGDDRRTVWSTKVPVRDSQGNIVGLAGITRDITEIKRMEGERRHLEARVQQQQKLESLGLLAGGIAHDFNNLLGAIMGASEVLNVSLDDPDTVAEMQGMITKATLRAKDLTSRLLAFARGQRTATGPVDLHDIVHETVSLLEKTIDRRIQIEVSLDAARSTVSADRSQLHNALVNLGVNASHAMPSGGQMRFSTREVTFDEAAGRAMAPHIEPGEYIAIDVADDGVGISPDVLPHIFDPFFTTKETGQGTGLGLATVHGIVKQHRGAINVESQPGRGSTFTLLLPLIDAAPAIVSLNEVATVRGAGCVLLVEDEDSLRATARRMLERLGYSVLTASDGVAAVEQFAAHRDQIDLVLLDMIMPRMNGRDCYLAIRQLDPEAQVILTSGYVQDHVISELRAAGLAGFLSRPYDAADLSRAIAAVRDAER